MALNHVAAIQRAIIAARVVAIADPSPAARAAVSRQVPEAAQYDTTAALLADTVPDVVHVCTPPHSHAQIARQALEAGCHVYVEKPFTESSREAEALLALAQRKNLLVCAGHQLLYEAPTRRTEALFPALGRLVHVESYFSFRTARRAADGRSPSTSSPTPCTRCFIFSAAPRVKGPGCAGSRSARPERFMPCSAPGR
jgi:predicted dehydrogenase